MGCKFPAIPVAKQSRTATGLEQIPRAMVKSPAYSSPMSRVSQFFSNQYQRFKHGVSQIRDTPHAIAGGVAIGVMFGFTPFFGLKTLLAVLVAWLFRCSKLSAVMAVTLHDVLLPLGPFILRWQYQLGYYLTSHPHRLPPKLNPKHFHFYELLDWRSVPWSKTFLVLWPTFVGSLIIATPISVGMYFVVLEIVKRAQAGKAKPQ